MSSNYPKRDIREDAIAMIQKVLIFLSNWSVLISFSEAIWWHYIDPAAKGVSLTGIVVLFLALCVTPLLLCFKIIRCAELSPSLFLGMSLISPFLLMTSALPQLSTTPWARSGLLAFGISLVPFIISWILTNKSELPFSFGGSNPNGSKLINSAECCKHFFYGNFDTENREAPNNTEPIQASSCPSENDNPSVEFLAAVLLSMALRWCSGTVNVLYEAWESSLILLIFVFISVLSHLLFTKHRKISVKKRMELQHANDCEPITRLTTNTQSEDFQSQNTRSTTRSIASSSKNTSASTSDTQTLENIKYSKLVSATPNSVQPHFIPVYEISTTSLAICGSVNGLGIGTHLIMFVWFFGSPNLLCRWSEKDPEQHGIIILLCFFVGVLISYLQPNSLLFAKLKRWKCGSEFKVICRVFGAVSFASAIVLLLAIASVLQLSNTNSDTRFFGSCLLSLVLPYSLSLNLYSSSIVVKISNYPRSSCNRIGVIPGIMAFLASLAFLIFYVMFIFFVIPQITSFFLGRMDIILSFQFTIIGLSIFVYVFLKWNIMSKCNVAQSGRNKPTRCKAVAQALKSNYRLVMLSILSFFIFVLSISVGFQFTAQQCFQLHNEAYNQVLNYQTTTNASFFSVMSWNILSGHDMYGRDNLPCVGAVIDHIRPSFLGLQESDPLSANFGGKDISSYLVGFLGGNIKAFLGVHPLKATLGVGLFTDFNVINHKSLLLPDDAATNSTSRHVRYSLTLIDSKLGNSSLRVVNVHAIYKNYTGTADNPAPFANRSVAQMHFIAEQVRDLNPQQPAIIMGDFNANPDESALDIFYDTLGFQNALHQNRLRSPPSTVGDRFAIVDHIFYRGLNLLDAKVLNETKDMSDHSPVIAYFDIPA